MGEPNWTLRLSLEGPFGERYQVAMPVDAFSVQESLVGLRPPDFLDMRTFEETVKVMRKRDIRHDILAEECDRLGRKLAQTMQDAEGWHDASRIEPSRRVLAGK